MPTYVQIMCPFQGRQLFEAAGSGNLTGVVAALEKGADVNWKKEDEV
jgi:hypothetical protein